MDRERGRFGGILVSIQLFSRAKPPMELRTFTVLSLWLVTLGGNAQNAVKLSTKFQEVTRLPAFDWNFPFKVFQYLPNPAHHGFEKHVREDVDFQPQSACSGDHVNLTVGSSGVITSPNYPKNYPLGLRCQWRFESEPGTVIRVTFFDIVTQPWFLFFFDYLAVSLNGNWDNFYRLTGDMNKFAPISLESADNRLGLRFVSGIDLFNYRGFKMAYVVTRRLVSDEQGSQDPNATTPALDHGNGSSVSAICDYTPITLPPVSVGEPPGKRVIGGSDVSPHEFPFAVVMIMDDVQFCSGSLIDESHVLTAAHCLPNGTRKVELYFGVHDMREEEEESRQYQVIDAAKSVVRHPDYDLLTSANDIAIVRLNRKVKTTAFVQPVYLPSVYSMANSFRGWKLITMGWGDTNTNATYGGEGHINPILKKATMPVVPNEDCRAAYRNLITGNILCTDGSVGEAPCHGDSGAPLVAKFSRTQNTAEEVAAVVNDDNQANQCYYTKSHRDRTYQEPRGPNGWRRTSDWFIQLGVLSFGAQNCGSKNPVAFTRVTAYLDFISDVVARELL